jgi:Spy/CpxP family protein refolding chaperone
METRKQYFGTQMLKSGSAAAAISLTTVIMVFSVAVLVPEPSLGGEQGKRRHPSPELMMDRLSSHLQLSPEQQSAMKPVIAEEVQKRRALLDQYRAEAQARRSELRLDMTEIDEDTSDKLAAILNPEQLDKFNHLQEKRRISLAASRHNGRGGSYLRDHDGPMPRPENQSDDQPPMNN